MINEFKSIVDLLGKIGEKADALDWPELTEDITKVYDTYEECTSFDKLFFECQHYLARLWMRVKGLLHKVEINETVYAQMSEEYRVYNYSYDMFMFYREHPEFAKGLSNEIMVFDARKMPEKVKKSFDKKIANR